MFIHFFKTNFISFFKFQVCLLGTWPNIHYLQNYFLTHCNNLMAIRNEHKITIIIMKLKQKERKNSNQKVKNMVHYENHILPENFW